MLDFLEIWKQPKMITYVVLTALLYAALVLPFMQFKIFGGHGDFGRIGVGVVTAFSFLFGPAAAWGAAIGSTIRDAATSGLDLVTIFGFLANFLLGYIPYKLWTAITTAKPDLRSLNKIALFIGVNLVASSVCGVIIGCALYWLNTPPVPFMPTSLIIAVSDAVWAILLGSILLAVSYNQALSHKLLYQNVMSIAEKKPQWTKGRTLAVSVFIVCTVLFFAAGALLTVNPFVLLLPALIAVVAVGFAMR